MNPTENQDYYCPTGFVFLENAAIGDRTWGEDCTKRYQESIDKLKNAGYIIQVAEPFTIGDKPFSAPTYLHLAIYIKRADGKQVDISHAFKKLMEAKP